MRYKVTGTNPMELQELANQMNAHKDVLNILWVTEIKQDKFGAGYVFYIAYKEDKPYMQRDDLEKAKAEFEEKSKPKRLH